MKVDFSRWHFSGPNLIEEICFCGNFFLANNKGHWELEIMFHFLVLCLLLLIRGVQLIEHTFTNYDDKILFFLTTYSPPLTFSSTLWTMTKCGHFWTTYISNSPLLVNIVCKWPLSVTSLLEESVAEPTENKFLIKYLI